MTALAAVQDSPPEEPSAEIYTVTPAVAKRWLSRNVRNRSMRGNLVEAYARDMAAGRWQLTGEAIKFDTNGALSDGQHRLSAVIKSGVSVKMLVVRGVAPEAQAVMDSGAKRSQSDSLTLDGVANSALVVATARHALKYPELGYVTDASRIKNPTNSEVRDFITACPQIHRAAEIARHWYPAFDAMPSVLAVTWMRLSEIDALACGEFFSSVANMTTDGTGDPRLALARRLNSMRRDRVRQDPAVHLSLILRAWNAWRRGKQLANLPTHISGRPVEIPRRFA